MDARSYIYAGYDNNNDNNIVINYRYIFTRTGKKEKNRRRSKTCKMCHDDTVVLPGHCLPGTLPYRFVAGKSDFNGSTVAVFYANFINIYAATNATYTYFYSDGGSPLRSTPYVCTVLKRAFRPIVRSDVFHDTRAPYVSP